MRRQVSLLIDAGHICAAFYPIGQVFDEAGLVTERRNRATATLGVVIQSATMTTGMGSSEKSVRSFKELMQTLSGEP